MSQNLVDAVLSGLGLQPKSQVVRTDADDSDTLPLSDFNAAIDPAVAAASTSKPLLAMATRTSSQLSKSETLTAPPSYNEAMTTSLSDKGDAPSQLVQQFFHGGEVNCLGLTKAVQPVVCLYYDLIDGVASDISREIRRSGIRHIETPAMVRLVMHSVANYAFMLAILHASSRYHLRYGIKLCQDDSFHAIRAHVPAEMLRGFLDVMPCLSDEPNPDTGVQYSEEGRARRSEFVDRLVRHLEFELDLWGKIYYAGIDSILDTGDLDGPKVQECWRLFKAALAQAGGGMEDLLPPPGYQKRGGPEQTCLRPLFNRKLSPPRLPHHSTTPFNQDYLKMEAVTKKIAQATTAQATTATYAAGDAAEAAYVAFASTLSSYIPRFLSSVAASASSAAASAAASVAAAAVESGISSAAASISAAVSSSRAASDEAVIGTKDNLQPCSTNIKEEKSDERRKVAKAERAKRRRGSGMIRRKTLKDDKKDKKDKEPKEDETAEPKVQDKDEKKPGQGRHGRTDGESGGDGEGEGGGGMAVQKEELQRMKDE
ncbi:hypothetical protein QBC45DRAFT_396701 [Copromyces sp. CBS 386.78]|nr:hypothetical protein QBC45DRAFT_396701 [Copromyces sp. CBS 386.78]